jgi:hypothetical protein
MCDAMSAPPHSGTSTSSRHERGLLVLAALIVVVGVFVRFDQLGRRSLWLDELSTWHVSRMPVAESLRWAPERTVAPLYQLSLRALTGKPRPAEWVLRFPAAFAGGLAIVAAWWLGRRLNGSVVAVSVALLLALSQAQIYYSQEARPYSMLVLGSTLSVLLWHRFLTRPTRWRAAAYIGITALAVYAHYLAALAILGEVGWWVQCELRRADRRGSRHAYLAPLAVAVLCLPLVVRTMSGWSEVRTALAWISPPAAGGALAMLADVTYGYGWLALLAAALACEIAWALGFRRPQGGEAYGVGYPHGSAGVSLLLWWLGTSWIGVWLISTLGLPLMVTRYVLPAAIPAMLLPLLVARRFHRYGPLAIAVLTGALALPGLLSARAAPALGFRELMAFLEAHAQPSDAVVYAVKGVTPEQAEFESLAFRYYARPGLSVRQWRMDDAGEREAIVADRRRLYVVAFLADPLPTLQAGGRVLEPFVIDGTMYSQLAFGPYRLLRIAALQGVEVVES